RGGGIRTCFARSVTTGHHGDRSRLRQCHDGYRARGKHFRLARHRPVLIPQCDDAGLTGNRRRHVVRRTGVYPGQPRGRHSVWRHRPAGTSDVSASAVALRLRATHAAASAWLQPLAVVGVVLAAAWLVVAVLAPWLSPYDPLDQAARLYQPPSIEHVFGTDDLGRDVFS